MTDRNFLRKVSDQTEADADSGLSQTVKAQLRLRDLILSGELAPGMRISEPSLVERLNVSRTPIRTALLRLAEEGLLESLPSGGYSIRVFTEADIHDSIEVRGTLEGLAVRLAAERGVSRGQLEELKDCLAAIDDAFRDQTPSMESFSKYIELNGRFHELLRHLAGSNVVARQIERATNLPFASPNGFLLAQAEDANVRRTLEFAQEQHRLVVEAIELRQGDRAEALMREHARIAHRNLQSALRSQRGMQAIPGGSLIRRRGHSQ